MKTASLMFTVFLLALAGVFAQALPEPTLPPLPPFHCNFRVAYAGSKAHAELASFIYKSLRALPGVGIVDDDPSAAILIINENVNAGQYACSFTVLTPQTPLVQTRLQSISDQYNMEQELKTSAGEPTDKDSQVKPFWCQSLNTYSKQLPAMFFYEGNIVSINPSAKTAVALAVKSLEAGFIEKQRRHYDYMVAHPPEPFTWPPVTRPNPKP